MLAIDWSHTRDFATYDGHEAKVVPLKELVDAVKGTDRLVIEAGAPVSVTYRLCRLCPTYAIDPQRVANLRKDKGLSPYKNGVEDDLVDAQLIYELGQDGAKPLTIDDDRLKLVYLYHQFMYMQRAGMKVRQVAAAAQKHFGQTSNPTLRIMEFNAESYEAQCEELKHTIERLAPTAPPSIGQLKGIGKWLWAGIIITANPMLFHTKAAYRKYIGLVDRKSINYKFNRNASRTYWLCADSFIKQRTPGWREIYDKAKEELASREKYTHPHGGATNRLMTAFANYVFEVTQKEGIGVQGLL